MIRDPLDSVLPNRADAMLGHHKGFSPDRVLVRLFRDGVYHGHARLDEDAARVLRDQLNDCLTERDARRQFERWPEVAA